MLLAVGCVRFCWVAVVGALDGADFEYISQLRASAERADVARSSKRLKSESSVCMKVVGHVFDKGLINKVGQHSVVVSSLRVHVDNMLLQILDMVEKTQASVVIENVVVGRDTHTPTELVARVCI